METDSNDMDTVNNYSDSKSLRQALLKCGECEGPSTWSIDDIDPITSFPQTLEEELSRLENLKSYGILDSDREQSFERITALAARIFSVPICLVSLVDLGRQWFMSNRGLGDVRDTPRKVAFCAHAIMSKLDVFVIPDAREDSRFSNSSLVTDEPNIRFYAGAPLTTPEGFKLGTLCLIDTKPWPSGLSLSQKQNLRELAGMAMDTLVIRRDERRRLIENRDDIIACSAHDLLTPLTCIQLNLSLLNEDDDLQMNQHHKELIHTTLHCSELMTKICHQTIDNFRINKYNQIDGGLVSKKEHLNDGIVVISQLMRCVRDVIETYPKKVPLSINVSDDVPPAIFSHDVSIFRSTLNFLTNACKMTVTGSINLNICVKRTGQNMTDDESDITDDVDYLLFECEDTGPGIALEYYSDLFLPFGGMKLRNKIKTGSMGLGLYSVSRYIQALRGEFGYRPRIEQEASAHDDSSSNTGSIFWFAVPIIAAQMNEQDCLISPSKKTCEVRIDNKIGILDDILSDQGGSRSKCDIDSISIDSSNSSMGELPVRSSRSFSFDPCQSVISKVDTMQILEDSKLSRMNIPISSNIEYSIQNKRLKLALIIDDSLVIRRVIDRALTKIGFEVKHAEDGMKGLKAMKVTLFDLVLCDFLMPIMDGLDCVQQYRQWERRHRTEYQQFIVGISAHANENDCERGIKLGMNKYFSKPITLKTLREIAVSKEVVSMSKKIDIETSENISTDDISSEFASDYSSTYACLIADDSSSVTKCLSRFIERKGWITRIVHNGVDALELLKTRNWDVVILNDKMSELSGSNCAKTFRIWERGNRVARQNGIYLMSESLLPNSETLTPEGFDGLIGKPFVKKELTKIIDSVINHSHGGKIFS